MYVITCISSHSAKGRKGHITWNALLSWLSRRNEKLRTTTVYYIVLGIILAVQIPPLVLVRNEFSHQPPLAQERMLVHKHQYTNKSSLPEDGRSIDRSALLPFLLNNFWPLVALGNRATACTPTGPSTFASPFTTFQAPNCSNPFPHP